MNVSEYIESLKLSRIIDQLECKHLYIMTSLRSSSDSASQGKPSRPPHEVWRKRCMLIVCAYLGHGVTIHSHPSLFPPGVHSFPSSAAQEVHTHSYSPIYNNRDATIVTGFMSPSLVNGPSNRFQQRTIDTYFRPVVHKSKETAAPNQLTSISKTRDVAEEKTKVTVAVQSDQDQSQITHDTVKKATISKSRKKTAQSGHSVPTMDMAETTIQGDHDSELGGAIDHTVHRNQNAPNIIGESNLRGVRSPGVNINASNTDDHYGATNVTSKSGREVRTHIANSRRGSSRRAMPRNEPQPLFNMDVPTEYAVGDWDSTVSEFTAKARIPSSLSPRIEYNILPRYNFGKPIRKQSDIVSIPAEGDNKDVEVKKSVKIPISGTQPCKNAKEALRPGSDIDKDLPPHLRTPAKALGSIPPVGNENTKSIAEKMADQKNYVPPHLRTPTSASLITQSQSKMRFITSEFPAHAPKHQSKAIVLQDKTNTPHTVKNPWHKVSNRPTADNKPSQESSISTKSNATNKASELSSTTPTPDKGKGKGKVLALEAPIAGWNGQMPRGPPKWDKEGLYDNNDKRQRAHMQDWLAQSVNEASENPIQVDVNKLSFMTGHALADGQEELGGPVDPELHESYPSTDPFTVSKAGETAEDKAKAYQKKLRDEAIESKQERRKWRQIYKEREASYVPPPNPHKPKANIYVRPGEDRDMTQITEMYNYYVRTSVVASERKELTVAQWRARWQATVTDHYAFLVAVIMHGKQPPEKVPVRNRRHIDETVVGFAFAEDYGDDEGLYRYTCELQFWVHHSYSRVGVGKTLVDRMLFAMDPMYPSRHGTPFVGGEDEQKYKDGGYKIIKKILIHIPFLADDDSDFKWQAKWLVGFDFFHVCTLPDIGYKFGKK